MVTINLNVQYSSMEFEIMHTTLARHNEFLTSSNIGNGDRPTASFRRAKVLFCLHAVFSPWRPSGVLFDRTSSADGVRKIDHRVGGLPAEKVRPKIRSGTCIFSSRS